jgi:hypothetical protein
MRPPPDSDETGTSKPEKFTVGIIAMIAVAAIAASCVRVSAETSRPMDCQKLNEPLSPQLANRRDGKLKAD